MKNKICITASIKDCYPKALVVFRGIDESFEKASSLGYDGIELALYQRDNIDIKHVKELIRRYNIEVPVISTGQMYTMLNAWFTHPDKGVRVKAVCVFKDLVDVAAEFHADINVSRVRGQIPEGVTYEEGLKMLTDCLEEVCLYAERYKLNILLEQMNRYETNYMNSAWDTGEYIRSLKLGNLKLHADLFHMNIEDRSIEKTLREYGECLGYIHFADSNRLAPGQGHINFKKVTEALAETGYSGWLGIEVLTFPDEYTAAKQSIDYIRKLNNSLTGNMPEGA